MTNYKNVITMTECLINKFTAAMLSASALTSGCEDIVNGNPSRITISGLKTSKKFAWYNLTDKKTASHHQNCNPPAGKNKAGQKISANPEIKNHQFQNRAGGYIPLHQTDKICNCFTKIKTCQVYAANTHTFMWANHDTIIAIPCCVGIILYPKLSAYRIDHEKMTDEIYSFINETSAYGTLKTNVNRLSYQKIEV